MSKQDTHFINVFSLVIALLVAFAIGIFVFARIVASHTQDRQVLSEADLQQEGLRPASRRRARRPLPARTIRRSAIKSESPAQARQHRGRAQERHGSVRAGLQRLPAAGIAGAPKAGDKAAWGPRIAEGKATLYQHALKGFQGKTGVMPAKGGRTDLPDDLVKQAVDHMVQMAQ